MCERQTERNDLFKVGPRLRPQTTTCSPSRSTLIRMPASAPAPLNLADQLTTLSFMADRNASFATARTQYGSGVHRCTRIPSRGPAERRRLIRYREPARRLACAAGLRPGGCDSGPVDHCDKGVCGRHDHPRRIRMFISSRCRRGDDRESRQSHGCATGIGVEASWDAVPNLIGSVSSDTYQTSLPTYR